jgi:hypothetical protein
VAANFLEGILARFGQLPAKPAVVRGARPKLAILTPLPPAPSGVAAFSAATLTPLAEHADIHIFTDTPDPDRNGAFLSVRPRRPCVSRLVGSTPVVSVLGNSDHHVGAFSYLLDHGGAAIAHDARMINFYMSLLGMERALQVAHAEGETQATPELLEYGFTISEICRSCSVGDRESALALNRPLAAHGPRQSNGFTRLGASRSAFAQ